MNDDKIRISPDALIAMIVNGGTGSRTCADAEFGRNE